MQYSRSVTKNAHQASAIHSARRTSDSEGGAVIVTVVAVIGLLVFATIFAVDVAWLYFARAEAQRAADAAALSAAAGVPYYNDNIGNSGVRRNMAINLATLFNGAAADTTANTVMGGTFGVSSGMSYLEFVNHNTTTNVSTYVEGGTVRANGVRIKTSVTTPLFFGRIMGINTLTMNVQATAILPAPGCYVINFPLVLVHNPGSQNLVDGSSCGVTKDVVLTPGMLDLMWYAYPTTVESAGAGNCGGQPTQQTCVERVQGITPDTDTVCIGEVIGLDNQQFETCRQEIAKVFCNSHINPYPPLVPTLSCIASLAGPVKPWTVTVPVVDDADLVNITMNGQPVEAAPIKGFAQMTILEVSMDHATDNHRIKYVINCDGIEVGAPPGGSPYNFYSAPQLVNEI